MVNIIFPKNVYVAAAFNHKSIEIIDEFTNYGIWDRK
jgi:hypothetical protein